MNKALITFNPKLNLSKNEQAVLDLLLEAGQLILPIYELQENHQQPGANFYPHDASREEVEAAAKINPEILSPYTVVERKDGRLVATPYHEKYANLLAPVVEKLKAAAKLTENKDFAKRLETQAEVLLTGDYKKAVIYWMDMKPYVLDINIGPVERYDDKLLFIKTSYQSWVGVMDEENTKKITQYKDLILSARRQAMMSSERVDYYNKVQTRIDDLLLFSGLVARTQFVGVNLPNDTDLVEAYGSEITIFKQTNELRHQKNMAIFKKIFSKDFQKQFTSEDLAYGSLYSTALHELAHTYLRYRGSEKRLKDLFPIIDELAASVTGMRVCGALLLKDIVTQKQLESIMLAYMCRSFHHVINEADNKSKLHYITANAVFINFLIETGGVQEVGGISWPNFTKIFLSITELSNILEKILSSGVREDAESFIKHYGDFSKLQRFK